MAPINKPIISESDGHVLKYFDSSHRYNLDGKPAKSITGVAEGYPKGDALSEWKIMEGAKYVIQQTNNYWKEKERSLVLSSKYGKQVIDDSKTAFTRITKRATAIGTLIHKYAYHLQHSNQEAIGELLKQFEKHRDRTKLAHAKCAVDEWWKSHTDEIILSESICASVELHIAGTFDAVIKRKGKYGIRDYKTSKRIYIDHFHQCAGYGILIPEWYKIWPIDFFEVIHFNKETGNVSIGLMDHEGYWLNGKLIISDSNIMHKMTCQFKINVQTSKFMREFKDFWKVANG